MKKMHRNLLVALLLPVIIADAIYTPGEDVTKPPKHRENLQWPPNHANYVPTSVKPPTRNDPGYRDIALVHASRGTRQADNALCPEGATGQFTYLPDCRKFINCWKGRGFVQACAPGTLFNPRSLECDFPAKVKCLPYDEESGALTEEVLEPEGKVGEEPDYVGKGMIDVRMGRDYNPSPSSTSSVVHRTSSVSKHLPASSSDNPYHLSPGNPQPSRHHPSPTLYPNLPPYPFYQPPTSEQKQPLPPLNQVSHPSKNPSIQSKTLSDPFYPKSQSTENPPRQAGYPSPGTNLSPSPWLQPPPTSNSPTRQPHSLNPPGISRHPNGSLHMPPGSYPLQGPGRFPPRQHHSLNPTGIEHNPTGSLYPPPGSGNPSQYPGSYPQSAGKQGQNPGGYPQHSGTYPSYPGNQHQHPGTYPQYPSYPGYQQPGSYPQSAGNQGQNPGSYPQHSGTFPQYPSYPSYQQQYPGSYPQPSGNQGRSPGYQQQYPGSYPQASSNPGRSPGYQQQYPGSYPQPSSNQQNPGYNPEPSRNVLTTTERHSYFPINTGIPTTTPRGKDLAAKHKSDCSMPGGTGVAPHPTDCGKYLNCWKGSAHTQSCAPGTLFNPALLQCDHPHNVDCKRNTDARAVVQGEAPKPSTTPKPQTRISTTKMPTYIMSIPGPGSSQSKPSLKQPVNTTRPNVGYSPTMMTSGQTVRLRGGPGPFEGYVEVQGSSPGWGLVCDDPNGWDIDEATVVCKQLGFVRGAELSWQGRPVRPTDDTIRVSVSEVKCAGSEDNLSSCRVTRGAGQCVIQRDAVGVRCYRNHASVCQPDEVNHGGKCYSVIVPKEDTALEAFSHGEALADCQKRKGKLLDITSQAESDFISELLLQSYPHINSIITAGVGVKVMGHPLWIWEGSGESFKFQKWWPGWTGNDTLPTASGVGDRMQCVVAKRVFPCQAPYLPDVEGLANLCEANYFYWATEDCSVTHDHPYVCERPHDDVGCVTDAGQEYMGVANVSASGATCIPWDSSLTPASLKYRMAYKVRQTTMAGHNHCRNIGGGETHPWCYVGPQAQFQYCDIPECSSLAGQQTTTIPPSGLNECGLNQYECQPGECISATLVCNKKEDCSNGIDENDCPDTAVCNSGNEFECHPREVVIGSSVCDGKADCSNGRDELNCTGMKMPRRHGSHLEKFECLPKECVLASRVCDGTQDCSNGKDELECRVGENVIDDNRNCSMKEFECEPGHCIPSLWVCDGVKDCPSGRDEDGCPGLERGIAGGLKCGSNEFECRPGECVLATWVCDGAKDCSNGRDEKDCSGSLKQFSKQLNRRLIKHDKQKWLESDAPTCADHCINAKDFTCRSFSHLPKDRICLLSDSNVGLSGQLNHTLEWQYYERVSTSLKCEDLFQCDNGKCVNKTMVCDGKNNCGDRTDERNCSTEYLGYEIRLAGGNVSNEGRVEVKVFGQWGAICDDLFGLRDADVVCRELNFTLGAAEVVGQSMYGGVKPVFLVDDLQCRGNETSIRECDFDGWGVHDCGAEEAVGVVCRVPGLDCKANFWRCDKSSECIPVGFLCDNVPDCEDGSDESVEHCEAPVTLRLVGGPTNMSGRIEVRYHGIWGTVCDDDFSNTAAQVICRQLGFGGPAEAKKDAAFGPGEGQIWLDQLHCTGQEANIEDCLHSQWGENNCAHEEDASVMCSLGEVPKQSVSSS